MPPVVSCGVRSKFSTCVLIKPRRHNGQNASSRCVRRVVVVGFFLIGLQIRANGDLAILPDEATVVLLSLCLTVF